MTKNDANPEPAANVQVISERALRRDRRWQMVLASVAGLLWAVVAAGALAAVLVVQTYIRPTLLRAWQEADKTGQVTAESVKRTIQVTAAITNAAYWLGIAMAAAIVLAAVATLLYVRVSHQASLRKIRSELADISAQLRAMN